MKYRYIEQKFIQYMLSIQLSLSILMWAQTNNKETVKERKTWLLKNCLHKNKTLNDTQEIRTNNQVQL